MKDEQCRKEGRNEGRNEGRKEGRKEGRMEALKAFTHHACYMSVFARLDANHNELCFCFAAAGAAKNDMSLID